MSAPFRIHQRFDDFDDLAETLRAWRLDLLQLERGGFDGEMFQAGTMSSQLAYGRFGRGLEQRGTPPAGLRTVVVPARPDLRMRWRGHQVGGRDLMIFPRGGELEARSGDDFEVYTLSFQDDRLAAAAELVGDVGSLRILDGAEVVRCEEAMADTLRRAARRAHALFAEGEALRGAAALEDEVAVGLLRALSRSSGVVAPAVAGRERSRAFALAQEFLAEHEREPVTVRELCAATGANERTLRRGFLTEIGVSPKAYLLARRLHGVRRDLRRSPVGMGVGDVARSWGFWHMGQFAADYRRQFGELPSATRRRPIV